jgi:hypothetical protein
MRSRFAIIGRSVAGKAIYVLPPLKFEEAARDQLKLLGEAFNCAMPDSVGRLVPNGSWQRSRSGLRQFSMNARNAPLDARSPTKAHRPLISTLSIAGSREVPWAASAGIAGA